MKIAILSKNIHIQRLGTYMREKLGYDVKIVDDYRHLKNQETFDVIYIFNIGESALLASKVKHKNLIIGTSGVEVYMNGIRKLNWDNVNTLLALQQHQIDYFKRIHGDNLNVKRLGVLPLATMSDIFTLKKNHNKNNSVAMVSNITGRKGEENIPAFLRRFKHLHLFHLGEVCEYGGPVAEFVDWQLKRDGNADRYHWKKREYFKHMNEWYEDKTYLWHPSISEGMGRAVLEGMTKGLMPIVKRYAGAEDLWSKENTYDTFDEIEEMMNREYEPEKYRKYVCDKYNITKIVDTFKKYI